VRLELSTRTGTIDYANGGGVFVDGVDLKEYPFNSFWEDLQGTVSDGNTGAGQAALTYEQYRDTGFLMYFTRHNQTDIVNIIYQMSHSWDTLTDVYPHAHVIPMAAGSGDVYLTYQYAWHKPGSVLPAISEWSSGVVTQSYTAEDQYKHKVIGLGAVAPPADSRPSTMLLVKLSRVGNNVLDTYTTNKDHETASANLAILYLDLHYQKKAAGTNSQY
jgi:hypothetical protein